MEQGPRAGASWRQARGPGGRLGPRPWELPPGDSPLPHSLVVFTQFSCFPSFLLSQTAGVAGEPRGGFQVAGCLRWLFKTPDSPSPT